MEARARRTLSALITLSCDSKCRHCYINSKPKGEAPELSVETWKGILTDFRNRGGEEWDVHGGEPLLYEGIGELLEYACSIGLRTSMITNAIHLDDSIGDVLSACSTYVLVSLDGPEENYISIRGVDKLGVVVGNVERLLEAEISVHPIHLIHKKNVYDFSWMVDFCLNRNIPVATLSPIMPIGRAESLGDFFLSPDELCMFIERFDELNRLYNGDVRFVTQSLYRPQDESRYLDDEEKLKSYNDKYYFVLNDGKLVADFDLPSPQDFILGDVFHLGSIDGRTYLRYREVLDRAFLSGLKELRSGNAINWYEVVQREASVAGNDL